MSIINLIETCALFVFNILRFKLRVTKFVYECTYECE